MSGPKTDVTPNDEGFWKIKPFSVDEVNFNPRWNIEPFSWNPPAPESTNDDLASKGTGEKIPG